MMENKSLNIYIFIQMFILIKRKFGDRVIWQDANRINYSADPVRNLYSHKMPNQSSFIQATLKAAKVPSGFIHYDSPSVLPRSASST